MAIFNRFDVIVVPFPFVDKKAGKRRPALVLSSAGAFGNEAGYSVMAMITSKDHPPWPLDISITELDSAGLRVSSVVRMKLFTLDHSLIVRRLGTLGSADRSACEQVIEELFSAERRPAYSM